MAVSVAHCRTCSPKVRLAFRQAMRGKYPINTADALADDSPAFDERAPIKVGCERTFTRVVIAMSVAFTVVVFIFLACKTLSRRPGTCKGTSAMGHAERVFVMYYHPSCSFCSKFEPVYSTVAAEFSNKARFESSSVVTLPRSVASTIEAYPTVHFSVNGGVVKSVVGYMSVADFRAFVVSCLQ